MVYQEGKKFFLNTQRKFFLEYYSFKMENLFKHKVFFTKHRESCDYRQGRTVKWSSIYKSNIKYNCDEIDMTKNNIETLLNDIKPFLCYIGSKSMDREDSYFSDYEYEATFIIGVFFKNINRDNEFRYIKLWHLNMNSEPELFNIFPFDFDQQELEGYYFEKPFEIHIDVYEEYNTCIMFFNEDEEYSDPPDESEDESEEDTTPVARRKSFNTGQCVTCLTNKPNILFTDCGHICVCLECEDAKPSVKCPSYRTVISNKWEI